MKGKFRAVEPRKFWTFRAQADDPKIGELLLYGNIGSDGDPWSWFFDEVTPKQFKKELDALGDIDVLKVYINSDGGDVFAANAMLSMLRRHPARVEVYIDGLAASAASVVAMAGDVVYGYPHSMIMIHNPWTWGVGEAKDFRELADTLDKVRETIIAAYQYKSSLQRDEIVELMDAETWMLASEAQERGFVDEIEEAHPVAAAVRNGKLIMGEQEFDLSKFRNPPDLAALGLQETESESGTGGEPPPVATVGGGQTNEPVPAADAGAVAGLNLEDVVVINVPDGMNPEEFAELVRAALGGGDGIPGLEDDEHNVDDVGKGRQLAALSLYEHRLRINERVN